MNALAMPSWRTLPEELLEEAVEIPVFHGRIGAKLFLPVGPKAAIIIALPSGIARLGRLELFGARALARAGFATLLVDLFTEDEDDARTGGHADVPLLADRILASTRWLNMHGVSPGLRLGFVGVGTAATAALFASALDVDRPFAVVSRGACASLASASLSLTRVPTLFVVDGGDARSHEAHREACAESAQRQIEIVAQSDGDGRDQVNALIIGWFNRWLGSAAAELGVDGAVHRAVRRNRSFVPAVSPLPDPLPTGEREAAVTP